MARSKSSRFPRRQWLSGLCFSRARWRLGLVEVRGRASGSRQHRRRRRSKSRCAWITQAIGKKQPWNTESSTIKPGETKTITVNFGKSYGGNPGFALDASKVSAIKMFAENPNRKLSSTSKISGLRHAPEPRWLLPAPTTNSGDNAQYSDGAQSGPIFEIDKADAARSKRRAIPKSKSWKQVEPKSCKPNSRRARAIRRFDFPDPTGAGKQRAARACRPKSPTRRRAASIRDARGRNRQLAAQQYRKHEIKPGETKIFKVTYGKSFGGKTAYALDSAKVGNIKIFATIPKARQSCK